MALGYEPDLTPSTSSASFLRKSFCFLNFTVKGSVGIFQLEGLREGEIKVPIDLRLQSTEFSCRGPHSSPIVRLKT